MIEKFYFLKTENSSKAMWKTAQSKYNTASQASYRFSVVFHKVLILGLLLFLIYKNDLTECALSKKFGYVEDFKFISDNTLIAHLDVRKIWKWYEIFMGINMTKITSPNRDLGLTVSSSLTWDEHGKKRAGKALNSLFALKRNLSRPTLLNRKNA